MQKDCWFSYKKNVMMMGRAVWVIKEQPICLLLSLINFDFLYLGKTESKTYTILCIYMCFLFVISINR